MKYILTISLLFTAALANANEVLFLNDNEMPEALKAKVAATLNEKCQNLSGDFFEESTTVTVDRVDQGVVDYFYTTTFANTPQNDTFHRETSYIVVKSAQYSGTNPTPDAYGVVESLKSENKICKDF